MYKTSKYNYFVNYQDKVICFNGISGAMFSLPQNKAELLKRQLNNLTSFEILYPGIFKKFKDSRLITDEKLNELDVITHLNRKSVFNNDAKMVINPTRNCNFNCWYCTQASDVNIMSEEVVNNIKQHITNLVINREIKSLALCWFGGEPLLGFNEVVYPISIYCKQLFAEHNMKLSQQITTNASLINEAMIEKMQEIDLRTFQITLDGDEKRHNKIRNINGQPTFKTILHNINLICKGIDKPQIILRINYDEKTLNGDIDAIFDSIPEENRKFISVNFQRVWQTIQNINKHNSGQENTKRIVLQDRTNKLGYNYNMISNDLTINNWTRCYVDKANFKHIDFDGKVYKCTVGGCTKAAQFGELMNDGTINWENDKISKMYGKSTFENEMCLNCKHLPLCKGPCSQTLSDTPNEKLSDICNLKQSEISVETFIIDLYKNSTKTNLLQKENVAQMM